MSDSEDSEQDRTLYVGNLSEYVCEEILFELFLQGGPVDDVKIIKDPSSGRPRGFGFVTYTHKCSLPYAMQLFTGTKLYDRELTIRHTNNSNNNNRSRDSSAKNSPQQATAFPNPYALAPAGLQGFVGSHASNSQMLPPASMLPPPVPQLAANLGMLGLANPMLMDPALLESLGSQLLLTNPNMLLGGGSNGGNGGDDRDRLYKHSGRERRNDWRDNKPYQDRGRDNYRDHDRSRHGHNRDHRHHDRHDNRRRR